MSTEKLRPSLPRRVARELAAIILSVGLFLGVGLAGGAALGASGCSWFNSNVAPVVTPVVNDAIDCVKTEAQDAGSNIDVIQAADEIITMIADAIDAVGTGNMAALWNVLGPTVARYGEATVACVFKDIAGLNLGSAGPSAADLSETQSLAREVIAYRKWTFQ